MHRERGGKRGSEIDRIECEDGRIEIQVILRVSEGDRSVGESRIKYRMTRVIISVS